MQEEGIDASWIQEPLLHLEKLRMYLGADEVDAAFGLCRLFVCLLTGPSLAAVIGHQLVATNTCKFVIELLLAFSLTGTVQIILKTFWIPNAQLFSREVRIQLKDVFYF